MTLAYYSNEIDKIISDTVGDDHIFESDFDALVDHITETIFQYHIELSKENLKLVVHFILENKYQKIYVLSTELNVGKNETLKDAEKITDLSEDESDLMSVGDVDLNEISEEFVDAMPNNYINPETGTPDKIHLSSAKDLICHRYDYEHQVYKENVYIRRRKRIAEIKKIPQFEQKSIEWLKQRSECLTATAIAIVLDEDPYKHPIELLFDKCGRAPPFEENENVHHGKKYEQIGNMFYAFRNNINVAEYGLIQHDKYSFIGASPDGICEKHALDSNKLSKLVGRLLEIKFPKTRKINVVGDLDGDICPHYYYVQVQTQLYVTKMDECDFLQCKIEEYDSWEDYVQDSNPNLPGLSKKTNLEKGCLIQLLPKKMIGTSDPKMCLYNAKYLYPTKMHMSHDEIEKWISTEVLHFHHHELSDQYVIDRIIYWRLSQVACNLIKADTTWFESKIPMLKQFWDYVMFYRENTKKLDRLIKYVEEIGKDKSAEIFSRIHKEYQTIHKKSSYEPLYQTETEWRQKYNKKYAHYKKFNSSRKHKLVNV